MEDDLPTEFDVIVVGTGMTESIVAAAASRVGKKVLHLDSNEYYGGLWSSFNFDGLQKWIQECVKPNEMVEPAQITNTLKENEKVVKAGNQFSYISNIEEQWHVLEERAELPGQLSTKITQTEGEDQTKDSGSDQDTESINKEKESSHCDDHGKEHGQLNQKENWSQNKLKKEYRKFNLDLAPKLLFARGSLVELLISSNIARYAEFRSVTRVLTWINGRLEPVPCSRADVFSTQYVSVPEKRMLMKLLTSCLENEDANKEFEGFENKTFVEYLKSKKLTDNLIHYVLYAIAMGSENTSCMDGVNRTQRFLNSLGRYGNTPFLWPMYGSGEIPQCFCRLCAVFGGLYHLKRAADSVIIDPDNGNICVGIISGQQRLGTANLVMGVGYAPSEFLKTDSSSGLSRGIFIIDRSILPTDKESLTLLQFPPMDGSKEPVTVIEVGYTTNACPKGLYVLHMTCKQQMNAKEDLKGVVGHLLHVEFDDGTVTRIDTDTQSTQTHSQERSNAEPSERTSVGAMGEHSVALKPQVLWSLYFNYPDTSLCDLSANVPSNVFLCSGPDLDLDFEFSVKQAKEIFTKMYPECEFLPRAPDPEEIVLEGEEEHPNEEKSTEENSNEEKSTEDKRKDSEE